VSLGGRLWLGAVLAALALGVGLVSDVANVVAIQPMVSISIVDTPRPQDRWGYSPGTRSVAPGTWVTWSNAGLDAHSVTATDGAFDSGELDPSQGFSWYFDQPGTFAYVCTLHPWMTGTIIVAEGAPLVSDQDTEAPSAEDDGD
jgi:plastocyanin